ncbi:hypothetical protein BDV93DRAFT_565973 [Ceratobasidium sp. AG-I]|nr:hypothetical protein BDV93DRAFT_565973 [Ceratobasidium sp. AG-I]
MRAKRQIERQSIEMPLCLPHLTAKKPTSLRPASRQLSPRPTLSQPFSTISDSEDGGSAPRRSRRARWPSNHKRESDKYQASSRGASRPSSPSTSAPKKQAKKYPFGKPGDRPGRLTYGDNDAWPTSHSSSPEPTATPGPQPRNSGLANQGSTGITKEAFSKAEAIQRATAFLGSDTSHLSTKTLKLVLAEIPDAEEACDPEPMEIEGGSAPAVLQSSQRLVLESGHQPRTSRTADASTTSRLARELPTHLMDARVPGQPLVEAPHNDDTATESKSKSEIIELGPGDSVSQQIPPVFLSDHTLTVPNRLLPAITTPTNRHNNTPGPQLDVFQSFHSAAAVESYSLDSDSSTKHDVTHNSKRRRLSQGAGLLRCHTSQIATLGHHPATPPATQLPIPHSADLGRHHSAYSTTTQQVPSAHLSTPHAATLARLPSLALSSTILQPPPTPNVDAMLAQAAQLANQVGRSRASDNQASSLCQAGQTVDPLQQLALVLDLLEDNSEILEAEAALALGKHLHAHQKPGLSDFPGLQRRVASMAIPEFLMLACTRGAYETLGTFHNWAKEAYNHVWDLELQGVQLQKAPRALTSVIIHRLSWFCGETKGQLRAKIASLMSLISPPRTPEDLRHNHRRVKKMLPNQFHCRDPTKDDDPYESTALRECIAKTLFSGPDSLGVIYHEHFCPIPIPAVAMVLTIWQECVQEWQTGRFRGIDLNAERQLSMYECHLKGLLGYAKLASKRLAGFREDWFWYGIDCAGAAPEDQPYQTITQADGFVRTHPFLTRAPRTTSSGSAAGRAQARLFSLRYKIPSPFVVFLNSLLPSPCSVCVPPPLSIHDNVPSYTSLSPSAFRSKPPLSNFSFVFVSSNCSPIKSLDRRPDSCSAHGQQYDWILFSHSYPTLRFVSPVHLHVFYYVFQYNLYSCK